ncbi:MAG TPA: anti-sigma factor [Leptolyngbyaceae cyanobacterium M33_DOE_097]|uniref:Regulator of SigK n=1 Tax=Oscillatoriales cyanobacterium SpSt-418 TaxID=2282169 RepID=A0A7C3PTY2_9CYAN|nr:anti-sigma factor [Leptolyngbyaceae cyanobacterium M33_DOE_097]
MARSMPSEEIQLLIAGYVLGELEPQEAEEFERLLQADPAIATEVAEMQAALESTYGAEPVQPPVHLRAQILDTHAASQTQPANQVIPLRDRKLNWNRLLGAVAAVFLVGLGINNYQLWRRLQTVETQPQAATPLRYTLNGTKLAQTASASLTVNPTNLEAELAAQNLPPLPAGKVYALWTVVQKNAPLTVDSKGAVLTQTFTVDAAGQANRKFTVPPFYRDQDVVSKVAITVEDASAPQAHVGSPLLITNAQS